MVMPPSLKSCPGVVGVMAFDFDHLIEYSASLAKVLVAEMVSEDEKNLDLVCSSSVRKLGTVAYKLYTVAILVVSRNMSTVTNQHVATLCGSPSATRRLWKERERAILSSSNPVEHVLGHAYVSIGASAVYAACVEGSEVLAI